MTASLGTIGLPDIVRYSGASGDRNPIHYDPEFNRASGYDGLFAMGALHGGWLISHAVAQGSVLPESGPFAVRLRFQRIVPLGVPLTADVRKTDTGYEAELAVEGKLSATVRIEVPCEPATTGEGVDEQRIEFPVELGAAREFAASVRWPRPVETGSPVPPTYPTVLSFWLPEPDPIARVGFARARTLMGETSIEFVDGPLRVGEVFGVREYIANERVRTGSAGELRFVDLIAEMSDASGLRARYRNTFILTPDPAPAASGEGRLRGSLDPLTGEFHFPERALSVDGGQRELEPVDLPREGALYSWTSFGGRDYGQVDLANGVRVQARLGPGPHEIGAAYRLEGDVDGDWWFARA
ncbi:FAS1-like dehydratase domain-containing protein [Actinomadura madurae]|uniref:FAS1-like dehydratase domain-containing protein n=1 Tax=Actinomadura madurae TaxID=1993 RepID=UPI0020271ACC|nr:MaoC family dehydratase N-terminal domain-containing protein [Actinomadura madurae]MCP9951932.1 MaoC family dehydratase N-terminal domain-containing protein [Actinomadura madurae]MCP9968700.1 MaoC family dehydratase N-terminal domain-containing protein [Actinomadura madurae]MCP9981175.1 MaoC family dehydratase N-terminal domain-containing protein [Actinomadura madurae]MCQ0007331.1 MaoC family dehydratase N-terminal domain-containing protein [Actinomadura madurae]MCQ0017366.1 MaoC family deh